jgi:hypothetical protein
MNASLNIFFLIVSIILILWGLSFAIKKAVDSASSADVLGTVIWAFLGSTPLTVLFTLLFQSILETLNNNGASFMKVIVLSAMSLFSMGYLGFCVYNYVISSNSGNNNNALNWSYLAGIPLIIILTLWMTNTIQAFV